MYIGKNFVGAAANAVIWTVVAFFAFLMGGSYMSTFSIFVVMSVILLVAFVLTYFVLRSVDKTYSQQAQSRVDRILTSLDDRELDVLRDRLSGAPMTDGEYGSLDDLMIENTVKPKRR